MAAASSRPLSQVLPAQSDESQYRKRVRSHYRPFSTLYSAPPYLEFPPEEEEKQPSSSRLLKRASSITGFQALHNMGLSGINFKPKKDPPTTPPAAESGSPNSPRFSSSKTKQRPLRRPSTANNDSLQPPPSSFPPRLKTKRSMNAIMSSPEATASSPSLGSVTPPFRPVLAHPPRPEDPRPSTASGRTVKFKEHQNEDSTTFSSASFKPMDRWQERHKMKYHPYGEEAVYMQAYDSIYLEVDRYFDQLLQRLSRGKPSFHDYEQPPATVLDLGCGQGTWVLRAASAWKDSLITGLDMVNVITDPAFETTENVRFVQGNFLKYKLPFEDGSFELVRMSNIQLGVNRLSWMNVLVEVERVLAINGRLEFVYDDERFPYADPPPAPKEAPSPRFESRRSSAEYDDYSSDEDTDIDTLQGEESGSGESSTLYDTSRPSSFDESSVEDSPDSPLPSSDTARPLHSPRTATQTFLGARYFSRPPKPVVTDPYFIQTPEAVWLEKSQKCQALESLFQSMLRDPEEYDISAKPHDLLNFMGYIFGDANAKEKETFSISIAEWNSPLSAGDEAEEETETKESVLAPLVDPILSTKKKQWIKLEWEKRRQKKSKDPLGLTEAERAELTLESPIPEVVQPKAAKKLGILEYTPSSSPDASGGSVRGRKISKTPSPPIPFAPTPQKMMGLSAKAAGRLGVTFTELTAAAAQATVKQRKGIKPKGMVQSPGLLVKSKEGEEYVRVDPLELEMHACKWMHTLLGCRQALAQYVAKFMDEKGMRLINDEMFAHYLSEYEGFFRQRFGWPAGFGHKDESELLVEVPEQSPAVPWNTAQSQPDKPIHIRTIRVYHAVKVAPRSTHEATPMLRVSSSYV